MSTAVTIPEVPCTTAMVAAAGGRNIWLVGGGDLVGQFYDAGFLDELIAAWQ